MKKLQILAGSKAYQHIRKNGLQLTDIQAIFGASGAAKWLTIYGLDKAIFSDYIKPDQLKSTNHTINLFGTSIGAFKLAAAAHNDPASALTRLANSYIEQSYQGKPTPESISIETEKIITILLADKGAEEILSHPYLRYHCGAVRCHGFLASDNLNLQKLAMAKAFLLAIIGRGKYSRMFSRTIFGDPRVDRPFKGHDVSPTNHVDLNKCNLKEAMVASGSIPVYMHSVSNISGDDSGGIYRDGGLLDYHPVPSNLSGQSDGLVLYPHFYPYLVEGWFDKLLPWRKVSAERLDNIVLISPSAEFVRSLPNSRIPSRADFKRYEGRNDERMRCWREAMQRSEELGEEWLAITGSGNISEWVQPL